MALSLYNGVIRVFFCSLFLFFFVFIKLTSLKLFGYRAKIRKYIYFHCKYFAQINTSFLSLPLQLFPTVNNNLTLTTKIKRDKINEVYFVVQI